MKKTMWAVLIISIVTTLVFAGGEAESSDIKIAAMATDVGGLGDKSFNDGAYEGLQRGAAYGFEPRVVESKQQTDYIPNLIGLAEDGANIVFAVGFLMDEAVKEAARQNPDTYFGGIDIGGDDSLSNFQGILYQEEESGFLAGIVAGLMTKKYAANSPKLNDDNVIGVVLGMFIPPVERYEVGFIQGAKYVNPTVRVVSVTTGSFTDQSIGNEATTAMNGQGADIVLQIAGLTGLGGIQAAKNAGIFAIGADVDQNFIAPDTVLTSALKNVPASVETVIKQVAEGNFTGGTQKYGLKDGAAGIAPFHQFDSIVPQEVKDTVEDAKQKILSGEIKIALTRAEIPDLMD